MKKIYLLFISGLLITSVVSAQSDTLLWENFDGDNFDHILIGPPSGDPGEIFWTNFDLDAMPDGSPSNRNGEWFLVSGYADADSANTVLGSNSWTNDDSQPVQNFLITPAVPITQAGTFLSWKSAPYQTPLYLDGYQVLLSTTSNDESTFNDTLMSFAEFLSKKSPFLDSTYNSYNFSEGLVHGADGQYVEFHNDSARFRGVLRPFSIDLSAYVGQTVFIAFLHDSHDDNLLSIDDILISTFDPSGIAVTAKSIPATAYPNPSSESIMVNYNLPTSSPVTISIYDMKGRMVGSVSRGVQSAGQQNYNFNVAHLAAGNYNLVVRTNNADSLVKVVVGK